MDETNGPLGSEGHRSSSADVLAAETIQASARGHLARRGRGASSLDASHPPAEANRTPAVAQEEHCAAEQLQALARGHLARKHAKQPRDRAASDSNATDASDPTVGVAPSPDEAAERLQALARGHLARKHHRVGVASAREGDAAAPQVEMGKSAAAETLQSLARGHLARKAARKSDHPVRNPDAAEPGPAERERRATGGDDLGSGGDVVDERGAGGGHAPAEGDSDANRRAREQEAATALQALARGHLARTHGAPGTPQIGVADAGTGHPSQDDAAIVLQALARGHLARRHGSGGHLHQRGDPSTDAAKEAASAGDDGGPERVGEGTVEADAAALLQSASKGHLARRHMGSYEGALGGAAEAGRGEEEGREESRSPLGENGAAILIQSAARGRLARKREAASMRGVKGGASGAQGRGGGHGGGRGDASEDNEVEERAATALQSLARGHLTRRRQGAGVGSRADGRGVEGGGGGGRMNEDSAASIVQSLARGHLARRRVRRVRGDSTRAGGEGVAVEHERTDQRVRDRQLEGKEREDGGERELVGEETMEHVAARDADVRDAHEPAVRVVLGMASRKVVIEMKTGGVEEVGHGNVNADEGSAAADTLVEDANGKGDAADEGTADEGGADGVPLEVASGDATKGRGNAGEVGSAEGGVVDSAADEVLRKSDSKRESKEDSIARLRALSNRRFER